MAKSFSILEITLRLPNDEVVNFIDELDDRFSKHAEVNTNRRREQPPLPAPVEANAVRASKVDSEEVPDEERRPDAKFAQQPKLSELTGKLLDLAAPSVIVPGKTVGEVYGNAKAIEAAAEANRKSPDTVTEVLAVPKVTKKRITRSSLNGEARVAHFIELRKAATRIIPYVRGNIGIITPYHIRVFLSKHNILSTDPKAAHKILHLLREYDVLIHDQGGEAVYHNNPHSTITEIPLVSNSPGLGGINKTKS